MPSPQDASEGLESSGEQGSLKARTAGLESSDEQGSLKARTIRGTLVTVAGHGFSRVLALAGNIVLSRLLFPEAFGIMALVIMLLIGVQMISDIGIQPSIIRHRRGDEPLFLDTAFSIQALRGLILWLVAALLAVPFARFYGDDQLALIVPVSLAATLLTGLYSTKLVTLNRKLQLDRVIVIDLTARVIAVTAMIAHAAVYHSIWALVLGGLTETGVRMVLSHVAIPGRNNSFRWHRQAARDIFTFGRWIFVSTLITFLAGRLDIVLLGKLIPIDLLGVYSIAVALGGNLTQVADKVSSMVVLPAFSSAYRQGTDALAQSFARGRRVLLSVGLLVFLGAALLAPAFFYFLYDERYHGAGWMAQITMITLWLTYLQGISSRALLALGDSRSLAVANTIKLIVTAAASIGGFLAAGFPLFLVGVALGAAAGHLTVIHMLNRHGLRCARQDARYTLAGLFVGLSCALGAELTATALHLESSAIISVPFAAGVLIPLAGWVLLRVKGELRR